MHTISADMLRVVLAGPEEHALIDIRREGEFAQGHLFFACNIPRASLELKIEQLVPRRARTPTISAMCLRLSAIAT
jgi:rhodanese-related sulfurtransferase